MNTTMTGLAGILMNGVNNPDCSLFVGAVVGQAMTYQLIVWMAAVYLITKALDKLALEPLINWIKSKIFKKKEVTK